MKLYVHHIPGRLRVRTPALKDNPAVVEQLKSALGRLPGVNTATFNPVTGSILVHYELSNPVTVNKLFEMLEAPSVSSALPPALPPAPAPRAAPSLPKAMLIEARNSVAKNAAGTAAQMAASFLLEAIVRRIFSPRLPLPL